MQKCRPLGQFSNVTCHSIIFWAVMLKFISKLQMKEPSNYLTLKVMF